MSEDAGHGRLLDLLQHELLGPPAVLGRREVTRQAGVSIAQARKFWQALGFPLATDDAASFTEADRSALVRLGALMQRREMDDTLALAMIRAVARTTDRLAVWQTSLLGDAVAGPPDQADDVPPEETAEHAALAMLALTDEIEPLLTYAWRRHLYAALGRMLADAGPDQPGPVRVVGFADLVGFTALVRQSTERELATLVQRFEQLASDIVTAHGGRVIKTVGDEVLFVAAEPLSGTAIALDLVDAMAEEPMLPQVRVGVSYGPVLSRMGDVFGTTVNRAARLTAVAPTGRVLADENLAARLASLSGFHLHPLRRRHLRGIGLVTPSDVTRSRGDRLPSALADA